MNIVVAEDEPRQRKGIVKIIRSIDPGAQCADFGSGREAMEYLSRPDTQADLLITDINMPDMDGLTLMSRIPKELPVVIISGYPSFEYARKAMEYGAFRYLLKPVDPREVRQALEEIRENLGAGGKPGPRRRVGELPLEAKPFQPEESLLNRWVRGALSPQERSPLPSPLAGMSAGRLLFLEPVEGGTWPREAKELPCAVEEGLVELGVSRAFFLDDGSGRMLVVLAGEAGDGPLERALSELLERVNSRWGGELRVFAGEPGPMAPEGMAARFAQDREALDWARFVAPDRRVFLCPPGGQEPPGTDRLAEALLEELQGGKEGEAVRLARLLPRRIPEIRHTLAGAGAELCARLAGRREDLVERSATRIREAARRAAYLPALAEEIKGCVLDLADAAEGGLARDRQLYLLKLRRYLWERCTEDLTLESAAGHFRLNPSYFSTMVKALTGRNFSALLTDMRMERACAHLSRPELRVQDVAELCGYQDASYFNRVFKRAVGMTPEQYRKRGGGRI